MSKKRGNPDPDHTPFWSSAAHTVRLLGLVTGLVWQVGPLLVIGLVGLLLGQSLISPIQLAVTRRSIDELAAYLHITSTTTEPHVWLWLVLLAATLGLQSLITPISELCRSLLADRVSVHVNRAVIKVSNSWPGIARFEDSTFADDLRVAQQRASDGGIQLLSFVANTVLAVFTSVGIGVVLAGLSPWVPLLIVAAQLPSMSMEWSFGNRTGSLLYFQTPEARRLEYLRATATAPSPAKDIRLAGAFGVLRQRYGSIWQTTVGDLIRLRRQLGRRMMAAKGLSSATQAGIYVYLVHGAVHGTISIGSLVYFAGATVLLNNLLAQAGHQLAVLPRVLGNLPSLRRVLDATSDLPIAAEPTALPNPFTVGLAFDDVHFTYPGSDRPVLRGVSFTLAPHESLALVGHNGAGKTTIIKLVLRLYDPTSGRITLDGIDIRDVDVVELRRRMGVIFQDFGRYELSAADNIGFGDITRIGDRDAILAAAELGGATSVVDKLPDGLDTRLGRYLGDRDLSGGQWQRIALSRAFMSDSSLLVLDEPTAELDPRAEYEVFERFSQLTHGRMTIIVSHRFSTVRMADRIVVFDDGRVLEDGSHAELMAADGEYARMFNVQASQYLDASTTNDEAEPNDGGEGEQW